MELFKITNTELRKKNPSEFGNGAMIDIIDAKGVEEIKTVKVCHCINWHPSMEPNMGKKAKCSYCKNLRH